MDQLSLALVRTGMGGGDCGYGFVSGESYFVYAYNEGEGAGVLWVSDCGATKRLAQAHTDLAYARQVSRGGERALLFGRVIGSARGGLQDPLEQTGIANVEVTAEGPQHLAAVTRRGPWRSPQLAAFPTKDPAAPRRL